MSPTIKYDILKLASKCFLNAITSICKEAYNGRQINLSLLTKEDMLKISENFLYSLLKAGIHYSHAIKNELAISQYDIEQQKISNEQEVCQNAIKR